MEPRIEWLTAGIPAIGGCWLASLGLTYEMAWLADCQQYLIKPKANGYITATREARKEKGHRLRWPKSLIFWLPDLDSNQGHTD